MITKEKEIKVKKKGVTYDVYFYNQIVENYNLWKYEKPTHE